MPKPPTIPTSALVPAAARGVAKRREPIAQAIQQTLNQLEDTLGGRPQLIAVLAQNASTTALAQLLSDLANPDHDKQSLATICATNGLTTGDLLRAYQAGMRLYAQTLSVREIAEKQVQLTRDVMDRALPQEGDCDLCGGSGKATVFDEARQKLAQVDCGPCKGTGRMTIIPDVERQKVALDLAEMLPKKGGLSIGINQSTLVQPMAGGFGGTLEKLQQSVSGILYGDDDPIEAEIVAAPEVSE